MVLWPVALAIIAVSLGACSGSSSTPEPLSFRTIILSQDLSTGPQRIFFWVADPGRERVQVPEAQLAVYFLGDDRDATGELRETVPAVFRRWPVGDAGVYTARLNLTTVGQWRAEVSITPPGGSLVTATGIFVVAPSSSTPMVGTAAPASATKTVADVGALEELTSALEPDPALYQMSLAEAVASGKPTVVVFATPAYCESATCGPQVEEVQALQATYGDRVNFIHVEIYDNPHEIQGDLGNAKVAEAVREWGLPNEPWTFIVDRHGKIADKFEAYTTREELEPALKAVVQ